MQVCRRKTPSLLNNLQCDHFVPDSRFTVNSESLILEQSLTPLKNTITSIVLQKKEGFALAWKLTVFCDFWFKIVMKREWDFKPSPNYFSTLWDETKQVFWTCLLVISRLLDGLHCHIMSASQNHYYFFFLTTPISTREILFPFQRLGKWTNLNGFPKTIQGLSGKVGEWKQVFSPSLIY